MQSLYINFQEDPGGASGGDDDGEADDQDEEAGTPQGGVGGGGNHRRADGAVGNLQTVGRDGYHHGEAEGHCGAGKHKEEDP